MSIHTSSIQTTSSKLLGILKMRTSQNRPVKKHTPGTVCTYKAHTHEFVIVLFIIFYKTRPAHPIARSIHQTPVDSPTSPQVCGKAINRYPPCMAFMVRADVIWWRCSTFTNMSSTSLVIFDCLLTSTAIY